MTGGYLERLAARSAAVGSVLCLGLDPDPAALPRRVLGATSPASKRSPALLVEAAGPYAAAIKPNLAFFEAFGSAGIAALERIRAAAARPTSRSSPTRSAATSGRRRPARRSRSSIGLGADAVTVNPYLGERGDRAAPRADRPVRVRPVPDVEPRRGRVPGPHRRGRSADRGARPSPSTCASPAVRRPGDPGGTVGLVVGATAPAELARDPGRRAGSRVPRARRRRPGRRGGAGPRRRSGERGPGRRAAGTRPARERVARASPERPSASRCRRRPATPASVSRQPPANGPRKLPVLP